MEDSADARRYVTSRPRVGVIHGKAGVVSNMYVVRSDPSYSSAPPPYRSTYQVANVRVNVKSKPKAKASSSSSSTTPWYYKRELQRKKRIAKYKMYGVEGKVKNSFKNGLHWIKSTFSRIVHGF